MKHQLYELQQMQALPLHSKINMTIQRVMEWYDYWTGKGEGVYLSWSGGKDSTVLKHIIMENLPYLNIPRVYADTGLEYPELKEFVKKDPEVVIIHPEKPFWQVVRDYGYPVISKEVSECVDNARKCLTFQRERERERKRLPYEQHYRKLFGLGEYSSKGSKNSRNSKKEGFP